MARTPNARMLAEANDLSRDLSAVTALDLAELLHAMRDGDFSIRLPGDWTELGGKLADTFNDIAAANAQMARELGRVGLVVGKKGKAQQRVKFGRTSGAWNEMESSVNTLIADLLWPTTEVPRVAREVGTEGKLGGQAQVKKVSGVWKDLTESVNSMASNLTAQVRNIADVTAHVAAPIGGRRVGDRKSVV